MAQALPTKRLGRFLAVGFFGVVLLLTGLAWDAVLHAVDPALGAREGVLAWRNPGHVLLGTGMGTVVVSLVGAVSTTLAMSESRRWARPLVRRAFVAGSTALVVASAAVTSWSATAIHRHHGAGHAAAPGHEVRDHGEVAVAAVADTHDHAVSPASGPGPVGPALLAHAHAPVPAVEPGPADHAHAPVGAAAPAAPHAHPGEGTEAAHHHVPAEGSPPAPGAAVAAAGAAPAGEVTEVRYGPFALSPAGAGGDLGHLNLVIPNAPKPCEDCFILGAEPDLVYPDGSSANLDTGVMLHHAVFFNTGRPDTTCGNDEFFGGLGERFLASGNERTKRRFPAGFGYHLGTSPVNAIFNVMNHSSTPKTVYFTYKVRWVPGSESSKIRPVTPVWLDMNNCRNSEYEVPAGPSSQHWQWKSTVSGRIVWTAGHVHDGGTRITLSNATTGQRVCTAWAGYGTKPAYMGTIESMSTCAWDALGTVRAGELLDIEAVYNASAPVEGAMGIMVAFVYETPDLDSGTEPPAEATGDTPAPATSTPPSSSRHPH